MSAAFDEVAGYPYVSLTTFRRNGDPVSTPVWVAADGDELVVITNDDVGKTKRLARDARVELRPSNVRGQIPDGAPTYSGTATVHRDAATIKRVRAAIGRKYLSARLGNAALRLLQPLGLMNTPRAGILIRLDG